MSGVVENPVVLITFAGRQDRMELLAQYVAEALRRKLIDEWHVWNFSRNDEDDQWLRNRFPVIGRTPDDLVYYPAGQVNAGLGSHWRSRVRAGNDVHIAIKSRNKADRAQAFEFVIGGWNNQRTALRRVDRKSVV